MVDMDAEVLMLNILNANIEEMDIFQTDTLSNTMLVTC